MDKSNLEFGTTMSVTQFMQNEGATELDVIQNPNTQNIFFSTDTGITGKVTSKINELEDDELQVARVTDTELDEEFWMICKKSTNNVVRSFSV